MEIRLLPQTVDPPSAAQASAESTTLVPLNRTLASRSANGGDTAYPDDRFVWSVTAGKDGSYLFYAVPLKTTQENSSRHLSEFSPDNQLGVDWLPLSLRNAIAQYQLHAGTPVTWQLLNVYA